MAPPLNGLRILDLSRALSGPFCTMILGDFGADVVKVEPLPDGDMIRGWGPFDRHISVYYLSVNRNKRSLALNFRANGALDLLRDMAVKADVVVENFMPGTMEKMVLDYATLRKSNPRLVYAGITGMGREGPYGGWPGFDQIAQGMSGLMSVTGHQDTGPTRVGIPIADLVAGMWAALGIQSAIIQRTTTGEGQRVETSLLAGLVGLLCVQGQRYLSLGEVPGLIGNDHPVIYPYGTFQAKDGPFNMAVAKQEMWVKLCQLVDQPNLVSDPKFMDNTARAKHRDELRMLLNKCFAARTRREWTLELIARGIPAGPILNIGEALSDPGIGYNRLTEEIHHPVLEQIKQIATPLNMEALGGHSVRVAPPLLGEHTEVALRDFGIASDRISTLRAEGVIKQYEKPETDTDGHSPI